MGRAERAASKNNSKGQVWKRNVKSDDSDEDYMLEEDEADDQSDELESLCGDASDEESLGSFVDEEEEEEEEIVRKKVVRSKSRKRSMGRMKNGINKSSKKRTRIAYDEEDDEDYHDEDDGGGDDDDDAVKSSKKRKGTAYDDEDDEDYHDEDDRGGDDDEDGAINKVSKKRKRTAYDEEDDEDYHDEDDPDGDDDKDDAINKISKKRKRIAYDEEDDEDYHDEDDGGSDDADYDDDDDGADDDEFTPDELDFLDEEEELPSSKGKTKKKGRRSKKKKGSVRSRKRKTGEKLLKKYGKKKRKGSSRSIKSTSGRSRKSMDKGLSSRSKCKRMPTGRKKKTKPSSDSDFVSSEASDYEFTISEEEREQVREANEFCMGLSSNSRNSKKDQEDATYNQPRNLPRRKGKEKVEEIKNDVGKQVCGICLTEEGKNTVRGTLNCCNHFFCFACIIEWSKVESRCPLCKQRFLTISKPARSTTWIDLRDVVIHVPERDQVYQPSEEELRDYLDPYENVTCTECHEGGDDALMLLCDLCDSPAHTYCVGLGREVPEGNWYCEGCKPSALGFTSSQAPDLTPAQRANNSASIEPPTFENMAEIDLNITIPETPMTPVNGFLVSPRQPSCGGLQAPAPLSGVGVSTVSGRRRVHRFQYLRSSNRLNHMAVRVDRTSATNFPGPWEDRAAQPSSLETGTTDAGTSYRAEYMGRLQENPSGPAQNGESFPGRLNLMRGQVLQVPSAADGSSYGCMQLGGVGGINLGLNCIPGREHLQPCTSRLNSGSGTGMSPLYKRDVESLVKSQLKNLCRDMDLGHDTFKQIIRSSTDTILAACGLEHPRTEVHELQPPICLHNEALAGQQTSLLKGCCQACFDSFVRDVVRMTVETRPPHQLGFRNY